MNFYKVTPVQEWTCTNIVEYYRKELNIQLELAKVLDDIKKNLSNVADVKFGFDETRRIKAQELINNWKNWTVPVKKIYKSNRTYKKIGVVRVKQQLNAIKNSANQIDIFQKQFIYDSQKRPEQTNDEQTDEEILGESDHKRKTKRTKIEHFFPVRNNIQPDQRSFDNVNNDEELSGITLVPPDDNSNIQEQYHQLDGYVTPSPRSPMLNSTVELPRVKPKSTILVDIDNNPFIEKSDTILSIDDIPCDLTFENEVTTNDILIGETNVSLLFRNYQNKSLELARTKGLFVETNVHEILSLSSILLLTTNSHSNVMIDLFGSPSLEQIHQEFMPEQQIELDPKCESTFRKAIKMAMKQSCEDATNWFYGQLANENNLRENAGCTISDCLRTLPMSTIKNDHSETTHITNYLDRIMRGFFDDPNRHIVQWPNTALEESRARKFEGRTKQPDFTVSVIHQLQTKAV